jgi:translation initiation factor IF-2
MTTSKSSTGKKKTSDDADSKLKKSKDASAAPKARKKVVKKREEEEEVKPAKSLKPFITPPKPVVVAPPAATLAPKVVPPVAKPAVQAAPAAPAKPAEPKAPTDAKPAAPKSAPASGSVAPMAKPVVAKPVQAPAPYVKSFAPQPARPAPHNPSGPRRVPPPRPAAPPPPPPPQRQEKREPAKTLIEALAAAASSETQNVSTKKKIQFNEMMTVKDLAAAMGVAIPEMIKKLLSLGAPATINQRIPSETAALLAEAFGFEFEVKSLYTEEKAEVELDSEKMKSRPPIVTVMGHVDHGKTSLLDAIRSASVASGEAGGITQHIGAYQVKTPTGAVTFLDTPGHEAFTAMRARGAMVTDIVVLVVGADDSVMPQTIEAINHARAANVPIVVAINKVDLPVANVQKVKQELAHHNLVAEDWGGKTIMVEVSAKTKHNVDKLLEMLSLEAELLELKANPDRPARGIVLEAHMDPRRGIVATVLVQSGTLKMGDVLVCGLTSGRARAMLDEKWKPIANAGPSTPLRLLGLSEVPQVGDQFSVVSSDREAREIMERRAQTMTDTSARKSSHVSLEGLHAKIAEGKIQELPVILKTDVQGSMQAIMDTLGKMSGYSIQLRFVHSGIGNINDSDILLAEAADAIVFGFHVKVEASAEAEAKRSGVDIRTYQIIYEMLADIKAAMEGLLKPEEREVVKGKAQIKGMFPSAKYGMVGGCIVIEGTITRNSKARVVRNGKVIGTGNISSLRRFKDDVKEVEKGYECGLSVENVRAFELGDIVEAFSIEKHARRLDA